MMLDIFLIRRELCCNFINKGGDIMRCRRIIIENCETDYLIYDNGTVWNERTNRTIDPVYIDDRICKNDANYHANHHRYLHVVLWFRQTRYAFRLDRLVASYFVPNPNGFQYVAHLDGDETNNNASNLTWLNKSTVSRISLRMLNPEIIHEACRQIVAGKRVCEIVKSTGLNRHVIKRLKYYNTFPEISEQYGLHYERESNKDTVWNPEIRQKVIDIIKESDPPSKEIAAILGVPATSLFLDKVRALRKTVKNPSKQVRKSNTDPQRLAQYARSITSEW